MEIRDPIHGSIALNKLETRVIDSAPFQRLRSIKQLGFAEFSFPGAVHNRYLHSIGVCHLSGLAFESIFSDFKFSKPEVRDRLKQAVRLAALLHDIGHGPLSHTTEEVMPPVALLDIRAYDSLRSDIQVETHFTNKDRLADHEDYTIKLITHAELANILSDNQLGMTALHVACLINKSLECPDDFFIDQGLNFRTILSQLVSSEMDVDRMDYLQRDSYFCGTNYGKVELEWLIAHMTYHEINGQLHLALNRRALYAFDDFLLSRHHMHLMVYFHHKCIIYEEMLLRYLTSKDCQFNLPADPEEYLKFTDYSLYEHLREMDNPWAQRISKRDPHKMLFELHSVKPNSRLEDMKKALESEGIEVILANSTARLSKYHTASPGERSFQIFVVDQWDKRSKPYPIEESTEIFEKYEEIRRIERLYVSADQMKVAEKLITERML